MHASRGSAESDAAQRRTRSPDRVSNSTISSSIENEKYYHGLLPREDVVELLKENGDFVLRTSEAKPGEPRSHILSVLTDKEQPIKHLIVYSDAHGKKFWIDKMSFESIQQMISYYTADTGKCFVKLVRGVPRVSWELEHESITIVKKLGEGAFGEVSMGVFKVKRTGKGVQVAVKQAKLDKLNKEQIKEFMLEARHLRTFNHPNIVKFYGVAVLQEPLYMVMELASHGALDGFLKKNSDLSTEKRNEMILQAAWGIEYLHAKLVIHRDIAARNCLYGDQKVKISDFGLSRNGVSYQMEQSRRIPIRWCAVETLRQGLYTPKTDVWSYGIMCWEIYHSCSTEPYAGISTTDVNQKLRGGLRLEVPKTLPGEIQKMIQNCWLEKPEDRPTMTDITNILQIVTGIKRPSKGSGEKSQEKSRETSREGSRSKSRELSNEKVEEGKVPKTNRRARKKTASMPK